jgi:hypothetical protein
MNLEKCENFGRLSDGPQREQKSGSMKRSAIQTRYVYRVLVGRTEGKRPLGRPRRRWEDNIKMDLQEIGGGCGDWIELAQDRDRWRALVGTVRSSINAGNFLTSCKVYWLASQEGLCSME